MKLLLLARNFSWSKLKLTFFYQVPAPCSIRWSGFYNPLELKSPALMAITEASQSSSLPHCTVALHCCTIALLLHRVAWAPAPIKSLVKPAICETIGWLASRGGEIHLRRSRQPCWRFTCHVSIPQWTRNCQWRFAWFMHACYVKKSTIPCQNYFQKDPISRISL